MQKGNLIMNVKLNKKVEYLLSVIEKLNYDIQKEDEDFYSIRAFSPCGQDCIASINTENDANLFIANIKDYADNFDVSYETYLWLDNTGHGTNGAPYDMKDVYEDMEWWKNSLNKLANTLDTILNEYDCAVKE